MRDEFSDQRFGGGGWLRHCVAGRARGSSIDFLRPSRAIPSLAEIVSPKSRRVNNQSREAWLAKSPSFWLRVLLAQFLA